MGDAFPSIQSFYSRELSSNAYTERTSTHEPGDGFTSSEVEVALDPLSCSWKPSRHYETCPISLLQSGPNNYEISGRIVNFSVNFRQQDFHFIVLTDGSGVLAVSLVCTG